MVLLYTLKVVGIMAATAVAELWASGQRAVAVAALPMLVMMWYATRLYAARRRARERVPA